MFHNYKPLITMHKRPFQISKWNKDTRDPNTTRFGGGHYSSPVNCEGVIATITKLDYERHPDFEIHTSDLKLITSSDYMNGIVIEVKDKIIFDDLTYWVHKLLDRAYYGNYIIAILKKDEFK